MNNNEIDANADYVLRGTVRIRVLSRLIDANTPSKTAAEIKADRANLSRTLRDLEDRGLVECTTPGVRVGKLYKTTEVGVKVLNRIESKVGMDVLSIIKHGQQGTRQ